MARSADCTCANNFTCGHCLQNAPAWVWTPSKASFSPPVNPYTGMTVAEMEANRARLAKIHRSERRP